MDIEEFVTERMRSEGIYDDNYITKVAERARILSQDLLRSD